MEFLILNPHFRNNFNIEIIISPLSIVVSVAIVSISVWPVSVSVVSVPGISLSLWVRSRLLLRGTKSHCQEGGHLGRIVLYEWRESSYLQRR